MILNKESISLDEFVKDAKRNSPTECPVALAIREKFGTFLNPVVKVEVLGNKVNIEFKDGKHIKTVIEESLSQDIKHYDETGEWPKNKEMVVQWHTKGSNIERYEGSYERINT